VYLAEPAAAAAHGIKVFEQQVDDQGRIGGGKLSRTTRTRACTSLKLDESTIEAALQRAAAYAVDPATAAFFDAHFDVARLAKNKLSLAQLKERAEALCCQGETAELIVDDGVTNAHALRARAIAAANRAELEAGRAAWTARDATGAQTLTLAAAPASALASSAPALAPSYMTDAKDSTTGKMEKSAKEREQAEAASRAAERADATARLFARAAETVEDATRSAAEVAQSADDALRGIATSIRDEAYQRADDDVQQLEKSFSSKKLIAMQYRQALGTRIKLTPELCATLVQEARGREDKKPAHAKAYALMEQEAQEELQRIRLSMRQPGWLGEYMDQMTRPNSKYDIPYTCDNADEAEAEENREIYAPRETWDADAWGWLKDRDSTAEKENKNRFILAEKVRICTLLQCISEAIRSRAASNGAHLKRTGYFATNAEVFYFIATFATKNSRFSELCYWLRRAWRMAGASESDAWREAHPDWLVHVSSLQWTIESGAYPGPSALEEEVPEPERNPDGSASRHRSRAIASDSSLHAHTGVSKRRRV
jgi:hypothetical protein